MWGAGVQKYLSVGGTFSNLSSCAWLLPPLGWERYQRLSASAEVLRDDEADNNFSGINAKELGYLVWGKWTLMWAALVVHVKSTN